MGRVILLVYGLPGSGKTSLLESVKDVMGDRFYIIKTITNRPRRTGDKHYIYVTTDEFEKMIENGKLLEYDIVDGYYYGTLKDEFDNNWEIGGKAITIRGIIDIIGYYPEDKVFKVMIESNKSVENIMKRDKVDMAEAEKRCLSYAMENMQDYIMLNNNAYPPDITIYNNMNISIDIYARGLANILENLAVDSIDSFKDESEVRMNMIKRGQGRISAYFSNDNVKESNICVKCGAVLGKDIKKCACEDKEETSCSCCCKQEEAIQESAEEKKE